MNIILLIVHRSNFSKPLKIATKVKFTPMKRILRVSTPKPLRKKAKAAESKLRRR